MFAKDAVTKLNFKLQDDLSRFHRQFPGQKNSHRVRWTSPSLAPFSMLTFATSATASRNWEKSKPIKLILVHNFLVSQCVCFERYGDIFSLYVGRTPVVVLNTFELIKTTFDRWTHTKVHKAKKNLSTCFPSKCSGRSTPADRGIFQGLSSKKEKQVADDDYMERLKLCSLWGMVL